MRRLLITAIALLAAGSLAGAQERLNSMGKGTGTHQPRRGLPRHHGVPSSSPAPIPLASEAPAAFCLDQNYPNPFSTETRIGYQIAEAGDVHLIARDVTGREIRTLVSGWQDPGVYEMVWLGDDGYGQWVDGGTYYCVFTSAGYSDVVSMTLAK